MYSDEHPSRSSGSEIHNFGLELRAQLLDVDPGEQIHGLCPLPFVLEPLLKSVNQGDFHVQRVLMTEYIVTEGALGQLKEVEDSAILFGGQEVGRAR